ncbi:hypothetical protein DW176_01325 [Bacteroides fragilis]|nr:hypothetical protein DW176_01325 [Bacteroides fragilis]RHI34842.1 hypothetical protein DW170_01330 [Bacteroides fragilis]
MFFILDFVKSGIIFPDFILILCYFLPVFSLYQFSLSFILLISWRTYMNQVNENGK